MDTSIQGFAKKYFDIIAVSDIYNHNIPLKKLTVVQKRFKS